MKETAVIAMLAKACEAEGSQQAWAKLHGISAPYVNDVINGRRGPGKSILSALGLAKDIDYKRIATPGDSPTAR